MNALYLGLALVPFVLLTAALFLLYLLGSLTPAVAVVVSSTFTVLLIATVYIAVQIWSQHKNSDSKSLTVRQPIDTVQHQPVYLNIKDLKNILEVLKCNGFSEPKWHSLGLALGLHKPQTLDTIETNHRQDPSRCLLECLAKWLYRSDDVDSVGLPTWDTLANGLYKINDNAVADTLTKTSQLLQKYSNRISESVFPIDMVERLYKEGVIHEKINSEQQLTVNGSRIIRELHKTVYKDHLLLQKFTSILYQSKHMKSLANDINTDYNLVFASLQLTNSTTSSSEIISASNSVQRVNISPDFQAKIDKRRGDLGRLIVKIAPFLKAKLNSLKELKNFIEVCRSELKPQLSKAESFDDIVKIISEHCSIINITLLETIVDHYSIHEANDLIVTYKKTLQEFCEQSICNVQLKMSSDSLPTCNTIQIVVNWKADECTLNRIQEFLSFALNSLAKRVEVIRFDEGRSITITCYSPHHLMDLLLAKAQENIEILKKMGLIEFKIGYYILYSKHEEMSPHDMKVDCIEEIPEDTVPQLEGKVEKSHKDEMMSIDHSKDVPTSDDVLTVSKEEIEALQHKTTQSLTLHEKEKELNAMTKKLKDYETLNQELSNKLEDTEKVKKRMSMELDKLHQEKQKEIETLLEKELKEQQVEKKHETEKEPEEKVERQDELLMKTSKNKDEKAIPTLEPSTQSSTATLSSTQYTTDQLTSIIIKPINNERIKWHSGLGSDTIQLVCPTVLDVQYVILILKHEKNINNVTHNEVSIANSPTQCTLILLSLLNETAVSRLIIYYSTITEQCGLQHLNNTNITELGLWYCTIADINSICQLISTNTTLTELAFQMFELLTDNQLTQILDSLTINGTMTLALPSLYETKCRQHKNYQQLKHQLVLHD